MNKGNYSWSQSKQSEARQGQSCLNHLVKEEIEEIGLLQEIILRIDELKRREPQLQTPTEILKHYSEDQLKVF